MVEKKKILFKQSTFAELINQKIEKLHTEMVGDMYKHNMLHYEFMDKYHSYTSPKQYLENYKIWMQSSNPHSKYFEEFKNYVEAELSRFTGKTAFDKNEAETVSTMSGFTKKSNIKGQADRIAANAQREFAGSPSKRVDKSIKFDDVDRDSPDFTAKDIEADDPKKRTDGIDKLLGGEVVDFGIEGNTASL